MSERLVAVALPTPLYTAFDYRLPAGMEAQAGARVRVTFGRRELIGIVVAAPRAPAAGDDYDYKPIDELIDAEPLLPPELVSLGLWIADYYRHPVGEVFAALLPGPIRRGEPAEIRRTARLALTEAGATGMVSLSPKARAQNAVLEQLRAGPAPRTALKASAVVIGRLLELGWIEQRFDAPPAAAPVLEETPPTLTPDQDAAVTALIAAVGRFSVQLLQGVTGSGKTEVYLRAIAEVLTRGGQALVLVPEIGLTPQLLDRVRARFGSERVAGYHSGLSEIERSQVWLKARAGEIGVVVGTRSSSFLPFPRLGLVIVDEEHDSSLKQQEGLRYSARDLAVLRGQRQDALVILGSATPSLESLHAVEAGRYRRLSLPRRVTDRPPPRLHLLDVRREPLDQGLSPPLIEAIGRHLAAGGQVLLFINRRGYAPAILCHECGWIAPCRHCDARMTWHRSRSRLICHHCGATQPVPKLCPDCGSNHLMPVGHGTERVEEVLRARFPEARCERFDSDRLRSPRALQGLLDDTRAGRVNILVGTQMLAKGHDFAGLTLVGIVDADQALYSIDFRALERMGQLLTQVAGRAGRGERRGEVLVQTHLPEHPALRCLIEHGYDALARLQLAERRDMGLPPYAYLALLRAEAPNEQLPMNFLNAAREALGESAGVSALGPIPAPMERRAGRFRAQLLLQARQRPALQALLKHWIPLLDKLPAARGLRWSIDVDPVDLY